MEPIAILMKGNQTALKFGGITSSKVISCPLWEACWSDFSRDVEDFSPSRGEALNFRSTLVGKLAQMPQGLAGLGILPKVHDQVLVIFRTVEVCDRHKYTNTGLAIVKKIIEIPGGRITQIHK